MKNRLVDISFARDSKGLADVAVDDCPLGRRLGDQTSSDAGGEVSGEAVGILFG
jgi:hypothetical protein